MTNRQRSAAILAMIGLLGLSASPTLAAEPEDPGDALVVRLEATSDISPFGPISSLHADGRLITVPAAMEGTSAEQWLSPEEVAAIRQMIAETQLFGTEAPATAEYLPQLRPGQHAPGHGSAQQQIVVGTSVGSVAAVFEVVTDSEADVWLPSPEAERLAPLADLLWSYYDSAGHTGGDPAGVPYIPERYQLTVSGAAGVALEGIDWPLATAPESLPVTAFSQRFEGGWQRAEPLPCAVLTADEAILVADALGGFSPYGTATDRMMVQVPGNDGQTQTLFLEALLPDERGCASPVPDTALTPGSGGGAFLGIAGFVLLLLAASAVAGRRVREDVP